MIRIESLRRPAEALGPARAAELRQAILALNLKLSDNPAFVANWRGRIDGFFDDLELLDLAWQGGRLVGHYGMRRLTVEGVEALYVDNFTVDPALQGQGLGRRLTGRSNLRLVLRSLGRPVYLVSRTQNPVVAAGIWGALRSPAHAFPSFDGTPSRPRLQRHAAALAAALWPDKVFHVDTGLLVGAYGGRFLPVAPTRDRAVADHFAAHVDLDRGDAIVQIARLSPGAWAQMLRYFVGHRLRRAVGRRDPRPAT